MLPETVWLMRHAETTAPHVFNGAESDVPLSELGHRQSHAVADWFAEKRPTAIVSSGMIRAIETARPIAANCGIPHTIESQLHERRIGSMSGMSFSLTEGPWVGTLSEWTAGNAHFTTPGAESFHELTERLLPAWDRVVQAHPGGRLVIVAHGIVVKTLLLLLLEGWDITGWHRLGRIENLSGAELRPAMAGRWLSEKLLQVPEVLRSVAQATKIPTQTSGMKSEA